MKLIKKLDLFKTPVGLYHTRTDKRARKKNHQNMFGSCFGFSLSVIAVSIIVTFTVSELIEILQGGYDHLVIDKFEYNIIPDLLPLKQNSIKL